MYNCLEDLYQYPESLFNDVSDNEQRPERPGPLLETPLNRFQPSLNSHVTPLPQITKTSNNVGAT